MDGSRKFVKEHRRDKNDHPDHDENVKGKNYIYAFIKCYKVFYFLYLQ